MKKLHYHTETWPGRGTKRFENRNETPCKSFSAQNLVALAMKYVKFIVKLK